MKHSILVIITFLILSACNQQRKTEVNVTKEATITKEQQEFCINTFKLYLNVNEERTEISQEFLKLLTKHSDMNNTEEWYQANLVHIDSLMHHCINFVKQEESKKLLDVLEKEYMNIIAHPNNTVENEWQLHSVLALLYAKHCEDDKAYWTKLAELGEWSLMHIEAYQMNGSPHPLYKEVLSELIQIYDELGNQSKKSEIEKTMCVLSTGDTKNE